MHDNEKRALGMSDKDIAELGMAEKSREFLGQGGKLYVKA